MVSIPGFDPDGSGSIPLAAATYAPIAQLDRATVFYTVRWRFESALGFHTGEWCNGSIAVSKTVDLRSSRSSPAKS